MGRTGLSAPDDIGVVHTEHSSDRRSLPESLSFHSRGSPDSTPDREVFLLGSVSDPTLTRQLRGPQTHSEYGPRDNGVGDYVVPTLRPVLPRTDPSSPGRGEDQRHKNVEV